jgi:hypothetical protein
MGSHQFATGEQRGKCPSDSGARRRFARQYPGLQRQVDRRGAFFRKMRFGSPKPLLQKETALFLELSLVDLAPGETLFQNLHGG